MRFSMPPKAEPSLPTDKANEVSDHALVDALRAGKRFALNGLMARYKEKLARFAWRNVHDEDVAQDIVQETFVKVYLNIDKYNPDYAFSTWLYQIALNLCRDYHRRHFLRKFDVSLNHVTDDEEGQNLQLVSDDAPIPDALAARQQLERTQKAIETLPKKLREALVLYVMEEKSQQECADILGVSAKTIETRVYRARQLLQDFMTKKLRD